jgi:DNA invertase Pin-like site-specific DNA recombinase
MTVYGYVRVSTTEQVDNTSMQEQKRQISGNAMSHNLVIEQFIEDGGVSGADPFFARLEANSVTLQQGDTVIVAKLDRFSRDLLDALQSIKKCKELGVKLIINGHGDVTDSSNIYAQLMLEILCSFAGHERRVLKERQKQGQAAKRKAGGHLGGSAKFGYTIQGTGQAAVLVAKPEEQAALKYAKEMRATGISFRAISAILKTSHGVIVSHEAIRRALQGETA